MIEQKHKISMSEKIAYLIGFVKAGRATTFATDWEPEKNYSELVEYIRKTYKTRFARAVTRDFEDGRHFEYVFEDKSGNGVTIATTSIVIYRWKDYATRFEISYTGTDASHWGKSLILKAHKKVAEMKKPEGEIVMEEVPTVDYGAMEMPALVEELDAAIKAFGKDPTASTFKPISLIKVALDAKIDALPLAQRAPYGKPMSDLGLYVQTITTQLENPMLDIKMFAGNYVDQMKAAVIALASAIG